MGILPIQILFTGGKVYELKDQTIHGLFDAPVVWTDMITPGVQTPFNFRLQSEKTARYFYQQFILWQNCPL